MSLNSEEYDVKNDDIKRKKEKGSFHSSLFNSRIYLLQEAVRRMEKYIFFQGSTFHSSFLSLNFAFIIHRKESGWKKASE